MEPTLPVVEASSLTTGSPGKSSIANVYAPKMILLSKREISVWSPVRRENHIDCTHSVCLAEGYTRALGMSWHFLLDSEGRDVLGRAGGWGWTSWTFRKGISSQ